MTDMNRYLIVFYKIVYLYIIKSDLLCKKTATNSILAYVNWNKNVSRNNVDEQDFIHYERGLVKGFVVFKIIQ